MILCNISAGSCEQSQALVDAKAIVPLIDLLGSSEPEVVFYFVRTIANITCNGAKLSDCAIDGGFVVPILDLIKPSSPVRF